MRNLIITTLLALMLISYILPIALARKKNDLRYLALYAVSVAVNIWCVAVMGTI